MSHLSDELLQAIKARCDAATPGPWHLESEDPAKGHIRHDGPGWPIATMWSMRGHDTRIGDAQFIAHARTDIPALLAHIEHLQRRYTMPCPDCDFGSGQRGMDRFQYCDGSGRMDVHAFIAQQRDVARAEVEGLRAKLAKAETAKAALVRALEDIAERFLFQSSGFDSITLTKTDDIHIRAALVRVKGDACPKN